MQTLDDTRIKNAIHARHYGASELMLATMTGRYPPPHAAIDAHIELKRIEREERDMLEEAEQFDRWFREYENAYQF